MSDLPCVVASPKLSKTVVVVVTVPTTLGITSVKSENKLPPCSSVICPIGHTKLSPCPSKIAAASAIQPVLKSDSST